MLDIGPGTTFQLFSHFLRGEDIRHLDKELQDLNYGHFL